MDVNSSPLALPVQESSWCRVEFTAYLVMGGGSMLPSYTPSLFFFYFFSFFFVPPPPKVKRKFHNGNRIANHSVRK